MPTAGGDLVPAVTRMLKMVVKTKPTTASLQQLLALTELLMQVCIDDSFASEQIVASMLETLQHLRKHEVRRHPAERSWSTQANLIGQCSCCSWTILYLPLCSDLVHGA